MPRQRLYYLDAVRVLACLMVVLMHSPGPFIGQAGSGLFQSTLYYLTAPCIGLFFMVSGALLLPTPLSATAFLRRRMSKILVPTLVWTAFYLAVEGKNPSYSWWQVIFSVPFSPQGSGILWFMYTLVGLYIITPPISRCLSTACRADVELYLWLWSLTMCFPLIENFLSVRQDIHAPFYYVSGYVGYFLLGYYMNRWPGRLRWKFLLPLLVIALAAPIACKAAGIQVEFTRVFWYLSIFVAIMCAAWFKAIHRIFTLPSMQQRQFRVLARVSALSFGIYLCHIYLLRDILWYSQSLNRITVYPLHTLLVAVLAFIASLAISYIISLLPFGAYIVGCRTHLTSPHKP